MRARPITPEALAAEVAGRIATRFPAQGWARVAVDGAGAARPGEFADALAEPLRLLGRPALRVRAGDFLRAASLRFELGREDPESYYTGWLDAAGLTREVLAPLSPGGTGRVLPSLRDAATDRASRAAYVTLPPGGVLILDGPLLLGQGLPLDYAVHIALSPGALARRTPPEEAWTLPAIEQYEDEVSPGSFADVVVRWDDPRRPALVEG
ncbi:hypothetical protein [Longispora albida]|uniref:hypothetical protein n=1 Tax=Longispora albida TaxID=203523 RepID=UPI00036D5FD4|nr:hypothetical protein [Longispora albida]